VPRAEALARGYPCILFDIIPSIMHPGVQLDRRDGVMLRHPMPVRR
tara:strand:+ start:452 stop:589 length:138 start_codon:yes stop_codon:yes gene_type:complete